MSAGQLQINPSDGKLYFSEGIGVWRLSKCVDDGVEQVGLLLPNTSTTDVTWTSQSKGIEQLVATTVWSIPGKSTWVTSWDRPVFESADPTVFPSVHATENTHQIQDGFSIGHARDDVTFLVANVGRNGAAAPNGSAWSDDDGATWTAFGALPSGYENVGGGYLAAKTTENWVWAGCHSQPPFYTTNHGESWTACPSPVNVVNNAHWSPGRIVLATDGTYFYLYIAGTGVYRSSDGSSWTLMYNGNGGHIVGTADGSWVKFKTVPGKTGELFYTDGTGGARSTADESKLFKRSTDGGETWTTVSDVLAVTDFGFGKEKPGGSYPTIFIVGYVSSVFGVWMSDDNCSTWTRLGDTYYPTDSTDIIYCCGGDMNNYGRAYVGFAGSGWAYYEP